MAEEIGLAELHGGSPSELDLKLWDLFHATATKYPNRDALVCPSHIPNFSVAGHSSETAFTQTRWTYQDLRVRVESAAHSLRHLQCGGPGNDLVVVTRNIGEWGFFFWVAAKLEMSFVPIDPAEKTLISSSLCLLNPQIIVVEDNDTASVVDSWAKLSKPSHVVKIIIIEQYAPDWLNLSHLCNRKYATSLCRRHPLQIWEEGASSDTALVIFTSGTIGALKACPHTHDNLVSQTHDYDPNVDKELVDRWLVHTPAHHIFAINNALRAWRYGGCVVFPSASFSVQQSLRALVEQKCTVMSATPTLVKALLSHPEFPESGKLDLSVVTLAGTSIGPQDVRLCKERLGSRDAIQAYGMSETGPVISWSRQDPLLQNGYHQGIGKVLPGASLRICEPGTKNILRRGETGELHVGGSSVISGYLTKQDDDCFYTDNAGRWLVTGDQAKVDHNGVIYVLGRYKDLIIRGGENIHPAVIEEAIHALPGVQAQVVGVHDAVAGEVPVAIVERDENVSKKDIREAVKKLGLKYSLQSVYDIADLGLTELPVTSLKKPKRQLLKKILLELQQKPSEIQTSNSVPDHSDLVDSLVTVWENVSGIRPDAHQSVHDFADSIMLLQYCDAVLRKCHRQLYLQDVFSSDTIHKQATILSERGKILLPPSQEPNGSQNLQTSRPVVPAAAASDHSNDSGLTEAVAEQTRSFGLDSNAIEACIPLRAEQHRMVAGQRPESYHTRMAFFLRDVDGEFVRNTLTNVVVNSKLLMSTLIQANDGQCYHAVYNSPEILRLIIQSIELPTEQATQEFLNEELSTLPSPSMFNGTIIRCVDSNKYYLSLTFNHSIVDAMSLWQFQRNLDDALYDKNALTPQHTPYSLWADLFHKNQDNHPAQKAVSFHAQRLRGLSRFKDALWPKQRAPGWMISSDASSALSEERSKVRNQVWDGQWEACSLDFRFPRRARVVRLPSLTTLQSQHNVPPELLTRCALVVFNLLETGSAYAIFNSWQSGRSWPFIPEWMQAQLPPPMSIDGPTAEWRLNMYSANSRETVLDFLHRIQQEESVMEEHDHAPWGKIKERLGEEGAVAEDASFRQSFIWDVTLGVATRHGHQNNYRVLEPVGRCDWADW
jgi:acyl-CoA synthetase (AMP-forming)/AMP-acid ligase II